MPYAEMETTWAKLSLISKRARKEPEFQFISLAHLLNKEFLRDCYNSLNRNKAVGVDNVSWKDYKANLDENLEKLVTRLKKKKYWPLPAKRVYIPKNEKEKRPLGIPALENKIVEMGITKILERIYEEDFEECSYGFRPERNCHQAVKKLHDLISYKPVNHVVEADIKGFFDNVSHDGLMDFLRIRIGDTSLLGLIKKFLKAGYIDDEELIKTEKGTPQGSILSPILANIFLHYVLDKWYNGTVKSHVKGYCEIVRYADDFVCVVQYKEDAKRIETALKNRFNKFGLEIHPTKSRNISFGRYERENADREGRRPNSFDFLGFTHFCDISRRGNFKVGRRTSRKKFKTKCKEMNLWLKSIRNKTKTKNWWKILRSKLRGHIQYYGVSENYRGVQRFYNETVRLTKKWLNRRSQKKKMGWKRFTEYLEHYPLPKPKIVHNFYAMEHGR